MDERRPEPQPVAHPRPAASTARLSPLQQAYAAFVRHALACTCCRDVDAAPCAVAEGLWAAYQEQATAAFARMAAESHGAGS